MNARRRKDCTCGESGCGDPNHEHANCWCDWDLNKQRSPFNTCFCIDHCHTLCEVNGEYPIEGKTIQESKKWWDEQKKIKYQKINEHMEELNSFEDNQVVDATESTPERELVFKRICEERAYQEKICDEKGYTKTHPVTAELIQMQHYLNLAIEKWVTGKGDEEALHMVRKVITIGVRCGENHPLPKRNISS